MKSAIAFALAAALVPLALAPPAARAQGHPHGHAGHGTRGTKAAGQAQNASVREFTAAHHRMMAAMGQPYTGDPDIDFRVQMIPHHQGAIDMAKVALRHARDPFTRQLAESVIVEQQREIAEMRGWLARRGVEVAASPGPAHVIRWNSYRTPPGSNPGSLDERAGKSWYPGSGAPSR